MFPLLLVFMFLSGCGGDDAPQPSDFAEEVNLDTLSREIADDQDLELIGHSYRQSHTINPSSAVTKKTMTFGFQASREELEKFTTALRTAVEERIRGEDGEIINSELSTRPDAESLVSIRYRIGQAAGDVQASLTGEGSEAAPFQMSVELNETVGSPQSQPQQP